MFFCFIFFIHTDFLESSREKVYSPSSWSFFCWRLTVCKWNQRLLHQKPLCSAIVLTTAEQKKPQLFLVCIALFALFLSATAQWVVCECLQTSQSSKQRTGNHGNLLATKAPFFSEALYTSLQPISHADYHQLLSKVFSSEW